MESISKFEPLLELNEPLNFKRKHPISQNRGEYFENDASNSHNRYRLWNFSNKKSTSKLRLKKVTVAQSPQNQINDRCNSNQQSILSRVSSVNMMNAGQTDDVQDNGVLLLQQRMLPEITMRNSIQNNYSLVDDYSVLKSQKIPQRIQKIHPELDLLTIEKSRKPSLPHFQKHQPTSFFKRPSQLTQSDFDERERENRSRTINYSQNVSDTHSQIKTSPQNQSTKNLNQSLKSANTVKATNIHVKKELKEANLAFDQLESKITSLQTLEELVQKSEELVQLQIRTVRGVLQNKEVSKFLIRVSEFQKNNLKDISITHRQRTEKILIENDTLKKQNFDLKEDLYQHELNILKQKEEKQIRKNELELALDEYMASDVIVSQLHESLEMVEKQKYSEVMSELQNLQQLMLMVTNRDQTPYQLLKRDPSIYEDARFNKIFEGITDTVGKQTEHVQIETAKRVAKRLVTRPVVLVDAEMNTVSNNVIENYKFEISKIVSYNSNLQQELAVEKTLVSQLKQDLEDQKNQQNRQKGDLILARAELAQKIELLAENDITIKQLIQEAERAERKLNNNKQAIESERMAFQQKIRMAEKTGGQVQAQLVNRASQTGDYDDSVQLNEIVNVGTQIKSTPKGNNSSFGSAQLEKAMINRLKNIIEEKEQQLLDQQYQLLDMKDRLDKAFDGKSRERPTLQQNTNDEIQKVKEKELLVKKIDDTTKQESNIITSNTPTVDSKTTQKFIKESATELQKEPQTTASNRTTQQIKQKPDQKFISQSDTPKQNKQKNLSQIDSINRTKQTNEINENLVQKNQVASRINQESLSQNSQPISTKTHTEVKLYTEASSDLKNSRYDQLQEQNKKVRIDDKIQRETRLQKNDDIVEYVSERARSVDNIEKHKVERKQQIYVQETINEEISQTEESENQQENSQIRQHNLTQRNVSFRDDLPQTNSDFQQTEEDLNVEIGNNFKVEIATGNYKSQSLDQTPQFQDKNSKLKSQRQNNQQSQVQDELFQAIIQQPVEPSAAFISFQRVVKLAQEAEPIYNKNMVREVKQNLQQSEGKLNSMMDKMRRHILATGVDKFTQTGQIFSKKSSKAIMRSQFMQTDIKPVKLMQDFQQQIDLTVLRREAEIQKLYLIKLKQLFGEHEVLHKTQSNETLKPSEQTSPVTTSRMQGKLKQL